MKINIGGMFCHTCTYGWAESVEMQKVYLILHLEYLLSLSMYKL